MPTELFKRATARLPIHAAYLVTYDELVAADTAETVALVTLPTGAVLDSVWAEVVTAFADAGSISEVAVEVGNASDPDSLMGSFALFSTTAGDRSEVKGVWEAGSGLAVKAKFTATGANFGDGATADLDAGAVKIHLQYRIL
jgi:hypothetical protein